MKTILEVKEFITVWHEQLVNIEKAEALTIKGLGILQATKDILDFIDS